MERFFNLVVLAILMGTTALAQEVTLEGKVSGTDVSGTGSEALVKLVGVNIAVENTLTGTTTGSDGTFTLKVKNLPVTLVVTYIGYKKQTISVESDQFLDIVLQEDVLAFEDIVVVGSRFQTRTSITSPVPIDNIKLRDLKATAQVAMDKMLHYVVPSFNSTQQTISDATAHFDPADLRGLGPSRTLVLINGKRKNPSSLVYINDTPGKGDVGVDMNSIPVSAIKRIEVLRDGASAQYGSDAIAGVLNVVLNDEAEATNINAYSGITEEGDGLQFGTSVNTGFKLSDKGFVNLTAGYTDQEETNRAGTPVGDGLFGPIFGDETLSNGTNPWIAENKDLGMHVGLPNMTSANIYYNSEINLNENDKIYSYGCLVYRSGLSYALYRAPYWIPDEFFLKHDQDETYQGFQPTFETDVFDNEWTTGFRSKKAGWNYDLSFSYGSNTVDYTIGNSINLDLGEASPTEFYAGGYEFRNSIINFDVSKRVKDKLSVSFGSEFRQENFVTNAGEEASYFGAGAQSFPGLQPKNACDAKRTNDDDYLDLGLDLTPNFYFGAVSRMENYGDFCRNNTFKIASRLKTSNDRFSVRGSVSSGFRAPSLHQIFLSNIQTLVSGGTISNQGTFNNNSPVLRKLGVNPLKEEESKNMSIGLASRPNDDFFFSVDFFKINLDDRIVYSSSIASSDPNTTVGGILAANNITSLKFFINAVNTTSKGIDLVSNYRMNKLRFNFAASFAKHELNGKINTPDVLAADGVDIFDRKEQSRILSSRPRQKVILGAIYDMNPISIGVTGTQFGEVTWQHASDPSKDQTFSAKILLDLNVAYKVNSELTLNFMVNNLMGVYPDVIDTKGDFVTDLGGRFKYPWEVNQFGFNGRVFLATANVSF